MSTHHPPKLPLKIFRSFCSEERLEELEGDLYEVYNAFIDERGSLYANLFYWWIVIRSFRSFALKRTKMRNKGHLLSIASLSHNIKIAWRNIVRRKTTTAINIIGLAIGISGFVAIFSLVSYELSFNKHIPDRDRIYRVYTEFGGAFSGTNSGTAVPVATFLKDYVSGIETVTHFHNQSFDVAVEDKAGNTQSYSRSNIILADPTYFKVVNQYKWLAGSPQTALLNPGQVVLERKQAEKYFGRIAPLDMVGRKIIYQDSLDVMVSGIVELTADRTDFNFTDFISFKSTETTWLKDFFTADDWSSVSSGWQTFIQVYENTSEEQLNDILVALNQEAKKNQTNSVWETIYKIQPLDDLHYGTNLGIFDHSGPATQLLTLKVLLGVAVALLIIAIFNFINLETAQAINKSKEVGLRKSLGVSKSSLITRFLTESTLVAFLAALVSLPLSFYGVEFFSEFVPKEFSIELSNPLFWVSLLLLVFVVGFLAGIYPAFIASSFSPAQTLKPTLKFTPKSGGKRLRKVFIVSQFIVAQLLVICTLAMLSQVSYLLEKEMGFEDEGVIYFRTPYYETIEKQQVLLNELSKIPQIQTLSYHQEIPARQGWSKSTMKYYDQDSTEIIHSVHQKKGDINYLELYQLELIAGRNVHEKADRETLINETYAKMLGFDDPKKAVGVRMLNGEKVFEVVGILKDFHFQSLHSEIEPLMYTYEPKNSRIIGMAVDTDQLKTVIDQVNDRWDHVYPDDPLEMQFMDETIESFYQTEQRTSKVAMVATVVAILISCLGLFGLISYNIIQKSKEVGIRKVLGASLLNIGTILSKEFFILILVAFVVAFPVSYILIGYWMEDFSYTTNISWWIYGLGGIISIVIALMTIGAKIWKASDANPVESLRYE